MRKAIPMVSCALALPTLLYLVLLGIGSGAALKEDRWLHAFQTVHPQAQLHSTSTNIGKHFLDPRVRKILGNDTFPEIELRSYRVAETPVQIIYFPPDAPLDSLIEDGSKEYRKEDFRSRRFRICRSGRNLLLVRMLTAGSPMGRKKVSEDLFQKIMDAFLKESTNRGHS